MNIKTLTAPLRNLRRTLIVKAVDKHFPQFLPPEGSVPSGPVVRDDSGEKIFTLWLQGEQNAPPLVKACARSVRRNCTQPFVVLDEKTLFDYIELPGEIMDKRRSGKIRHAHFADIARVELLYRHGGYWLDATGFVTGPVPEFISEQDFFVYLAGSYISPYSFVQNYFIRARKGDYLLAAWRAAILEYWRKEPKAFTYFMHQLMFRVLVRNDSHAKVCFDRMPHVEQDPTHYLWWAYGKKPFDAERFGQITAGAFFQKTSYKSPFAKNPPSGSFADEMINRMYL